MAQQQAMKVNERCTETYQLRSLVAQIISNNRVASSVGTSAMSISQSAHDHSQVSWANAPDPKSCAMKMASSSTFKTGRGIGLWEGLLAGMGVPYEFVAPRQWKKDLQIPRGASKGQSIAMAQRLFPNISSRLTLQKHDGRAEALLIAKWGYRRICVDGRERMT